MTKRLKDLERNYPVLLSLDMKSEELAKVNAF